MEGIGSTRRSNKITVDGAGSLRNGVLKEVFVSFSCDLGDQHGWFVLSNDGLESSLQLLYELCQKMRVHNNAFSTYSYLSRVNKGSQDTLLCSKAEVRVLPYDCWSFPSELQ